MKQSSIRNHGLATAALTLALLAMVPAVRAEDSVTVNISLKDHRFQPAELHAPAAKPITIILKNLDPVPADSEGRMLGVGKVLPGGGIAPMRFRRVAGGRYRFFDDFH